MSGKEPFETWTDALAGFQATVPAIGKNQRANTGKFGYSYADLAEILSVIRKPLAAHGFAYTQTVAFDADSHAALVTRLYWGGSQVADSFMPINTQLPPQQVGSQLTYMRRYSLLAILGIQPVNEDDDGAAAQTHWQQPVKAKRAPRVDQGAWSEILDLAQTRGLTEEQLAQSVEWVSEGQAHDPAELTQNEAEQLITAWKRQNQSQKEAGK